MRPRRPVWIRVAIAFLAAVPRCAFSRAVGRLAGLRFRGPLQRLVLRAYGVAVGVDFTEIRDPLSSFQSLQDFFVRRLRDGVRPTDSAEDAFVSPCDGAWGESGIVESGTVHQVKGSPYSLAELVGDPDLARSLEGGAWATLYLSPRDYHRFHAPCAADVSRALHVPGTLWPVNRIGLLGVPGLFARNERIVAVFDRPEGPLVLVAVGAIGVGRIRVTFDDGLVSNRPGVSETTDRTYEGVRLGKGDEWGRFELGSTIVLAAAPGVLRLDAAEPGTPVRLGERIGTLSAPEHGST